MERETIDQKKEKKNNKKALQFPEILLYYVHES